MEALLRNDYAFQQLYNCSFYNVSDVPLERRANVPMGLFVLTLSIVEWVIIFLWIFKQNSIKYFTQ